MLGSILNKSWKQHPTKQQLYGHLPPIFHPSKTNNTYGILHEKQEQSHVTFSKDSYTWTCQFWKTCRELWMMGTNGERVRKIRVSNATWWWWWYLKLWMEDENHSLIRIWRMMLPHPYLGYTNIMVYHNTNIHYYYTNIRVYYFYMYNLC